MDSASFFGGEADDIQKVDRYKRYLLNVDGLGDKAYTRSTTLAKSLEDTYHLEQWKTRTVARGVALRPDLIARAAVAPVSDKATWEEIIKTATESASLGVVSSNMGSAFHQFHERVGVLSDEEYAAVPSDLRVTYERYRAELARLGIEEIATELTVANTKIGTAGKVDGFARLSDGRVVVVDRKSGRVVEYPHSTACQMAVYSHADRVQMPSEAGPQWMDTSEAFPGLDTETGLVIDVTIGDEKTAAVHVYEVDLSAGWYGALLAAKVRRWRNRKDLLTPYQPEHMNTIKPVKLAGTVPVPPEMMPTTPQEWGFSEAARVRAAAEQALTRPDSSPEVAAAAERLISAPATESPTVDTASDAAALLQLFKTKAAMQSAARRVNPAANLARTKANLAADMVSDPNWPNVRSAFGLAPALEALASYPLITEQAGVTVEDLPGTVPADNPYPDQPPTPDPPSAPLSEEDEFIGRIAKAASQQDIGTLWSEAQARGVAWSPRLHQAANVRIGQFS